MKLGRIPTAVVMVIAVLWTPQIPNVPSLWNNLPSIFAYATPPLVVRLNVLCAAYLWHPYAIRSTFNITTMGGVA